MLLKTVNDGFDPEAIGHQLRKPDGIGLFSIRERLHDPMGQLKMQNLPQGGARFQLIVPLLEDSRAQRLIMATHPPSESRVETECFSLLVVDDHAVVRESLIGLLDRQPDLEVIGEAADGEEAIRQAQTLRPEAIIMDVDMPKVGGVEATRRIRELHLAVVVIGFSLHEDESVNKAMTEAGADAFVSKSAPDRELVETIRRTCRRRVSRTRC